MTFKEYQKEVKRTVVDLGSLELNLSHMILGIISENEEYLKAIIENEKYPKFQKIINQLPDI